MRRTQISPARFRDAHALVTGGSSGIGLALVRRLAALGAKVSVVALDDADLARLQADPPPGRHVVHAAPADVGDRAAVSTAVRECVGAHGPVDVLVTCAGVALPGRFTELTDEDFERLMRVDYFGTLWSVRAVTSSMVERQSGTIVLISSFAGLTGVFGYGAYGPPKFAVRGLAETLRLEMRPHGVHVGCVFPPDVDTPQLAYEEPLKLPETRAMSGTMRPIQPEVVADAILDAVVRRRARVFPGRTTAPMAYAVAAAPGVISRLADRAVARARTRA